MTVSTHDGHAIVSSDDDLLILVNDLDEEIGSADKASCHDGDGLLHRAFSVLLFNSKGELLLQQRAQAKRLWGGYWSNTCCSHPRKGESMADASVRRLKEEVGLKAELRFAYKFQYHADFGDAGAERELCWVYVGICDDLPAVNSNEISAWRYVAADALDEELADNSAAFTPWFTLEWEEIKAHYLSALFEHQGVGT